MNLSLSRKALALIVMPLLFDLILISVLFFSLQRADQEAQKLNNARAIVAVVDGLMKRVMEASTLSVRKKLGIGFEKVHQQVLNEDLAEFQKGLTKLEKLSKKSPHRALYKDVIRKSRTLYDAFEADSQSEESGFTLAVSTFKTLEPLAIELSNQLNEVIRIEAKTVRALVAEDAQIRHNLRQLTAAGFVSNVLLAIILTTAFNTDITRRLSLLMQNVRKLPEDGEFGNPVGGRDEIGQLDEVLRKAAEELKEAREKERFLLDNMPVAILTLEPGSNVVLSANPAAEILFKQDAFNLVGNKLDDLLVVTNMEKLSAGQSQELKLADPELSGFAEALMRDFENLRLVALLDVSERIRIRRQREQFVAMVSHDLRTPLTSIQASLELVSAGTYGELSPQGTMQMNRAESNVDRLITLINDLLALEKVESSEFSVEAKQIDLDEVVQTAVDAVSDSASKARIDVKFSRNDIICFADYDRLVQVLVNFLSNAIKFSDPDKTIEVESDIVGNQVEMRVIDHGPGIPKEMCDQIFERFVQAGDSKSKKKGTGLGLAICKAIIEQHKGSIGVRSVEGEGSTFWFRIPREET